MKSDMHWRVMILGGRVEKIVAGLVFGAVLLAGSMAGAPSDILSKQLPEYHALVVGINEYDYWPKLIKPASDAKDVAQILRKDYGFKEVRLLLNGQATLEKMSEELRRLVDLEEGCSVLIYFAGHGHIDRGLNQGYWVPVEAKEKSPSQYLSNVALELYIKQMKARHVLVVADSCFSGSLLQRGIEVVPDSPNLSEYYQKMLRKPARFVISSGEKLETVDDDSVFSKKFISMLRYSDDKEGLMSATEVGNRLQEEVAKFSKQKPLSGRMKNDPNDEGGQFLFIRHGDGSGKIWEPAAPAPPIGGLAQTPTVRVQQKPTTPTPVTYTGSANAASPDHATKESPWVNSLGMKFVPVPFTHVVFSVYETRNQDFAAFVRGGGVVRRWNGIPSQESPIHPVSAISWNSAKSFCDWLTQKERQAKLITDKQRYRLPTDIEWSCAVGLTNEVGQWPIDRRGRDNALYPWGYNWPPPPTVGNYDPGLRVDYYKRTSAVGSFKANEFGLHDMGGNVSEWVEDWINASQKAKTLRGGSWADRDKKFLLSSGRNDDGPEGDSPKYGFRVVLDLGMN